MSIAVTRRTANEDDGSTFEISVDLTRLSVPTKHVSAPKFSKAKDEQYWIVVGCEVTGELLALKRMNRLWKKASAKLVVDWDEDWDAECESAAASASLRKMRGGNIGPRAEPSQQSTKAMPVQVYVVCDSYLGLDQQYSIELIC